MLQDFSRLLDLCRQSIMFEDVSDIVSCVAYMSSDPEVSILRIKNRLDPNYNAGVSAGYRDVGVNLRLVCDETRIFGLHAHVCEVQLLLSSFAKLKVCTLLLSQAF